MTEQATSDPVGDVIARVDETLTELKKQSNLELKVERERIDDLESAAMSSRRRATGKMQRAIYQTLYGAGGQKAFMVPKESKLASIPELQTNSGITVDRWLNAQFFGDECGDQEAKEFAAEHVARKDVTTGSTGVLIPAEFVGEWIDMMRAQSVLINAGAQTVTMNEQTLTWSHQTSDPTATWRSAEGASLSESDPAFAARTLTARTLAVRTQVSLEASQDIPNFGQQITRAYTAALAAAIDSAGIIGSSPAPTGIQNMSGINTVTGVGTPTNWDEVVDGVAAFLNANNRLEDLTGIVMHPNVWRVFAQLKTGISSDNTPLELPPAISTVPRFVSTGADVLGSPEDLHITMGNFRDLVIGVRMNPTIRILDGTTSMASNLLIEVVGVARVDILALRPASFVVLENVTTA